MGLIVILIVVAIIWAAIKKAAVNTIDNAYANHQQKEEARRIDALNDSARLQADWNERVKQLNIDLTKAEYVKYYLNYYNNKNSRAYRYVYLWPVEGAVAVFSTYLIYDDNGNQEKVVSSPLTWNISYGELKDIHGVYLRNDVCVLQFDDCSLGYPAEEYQKVKKVYEDAKAMTT